MYIVFTKSSFERDESILYETKIACQCAFKNDNTKINFSYQVNEIKFKVKLKSGIKKSFFFLNM